MPVMNFDLVDGKPKVSFTLNQEDTERFMQFMTDCSGYKTQRDELLVALKLILDGVDYTKGACSLNSMVGACLDAKLIDKAHLAIENAK